MLPPQVEVVERGWLSCNNVLLHGDDGSTLVDSSYGSHAAQTLALVDRALGGRRLVRLVNTHCHSDHMGGNRAVQARYRCRTTIPVGEAPLVDAWDERGLLLAFADQRAERFTYDDTLSPGDSFEMGGIAWRALAAPGHDPHALMFHAAAEGLLISGDALWADGFGIVFPALFGDATAFAATRSTLDRIGRLDLRAVIPGHGAPFADVSAALERAHRRLDGYERDPRRLARHCAKVMLVFALLERRRMPLAGLAEYCARVGILRHVNREFLGLAPQAFADWLVADLERGGAVRRDGADLVPTARA